MACSKCKHFHLNRRFSYNTDYHGYITSLHICGYVISKETICFCEIEK